MCDFDEQPLLKQHHYKKIKKVGKMAVLNDSGKDIKTHLRPLDIFLLVGKQFNNKDKTGFGLNHIYYKHFNDIPKRFHCVLENKQIDYKQTIINFILFFLHDTRHKLEILISTEQDSRPLLVRSPYGRMVLLEHEWNGRFFYHVITFVPSTVEVGTKVGFYKSDVAFLEKN